LRLGFTMFHELMHLTSAAGDKGYAKSQCIALAKRRPRTARLNAQAYMYFAMDAGVGGKYNGPRRRTRNPDPYTENDDRNSDRAARRARREAERRRKKRLEEDRRREREARRKREIADKKERDRLRKARCKNKPRTRKETWAEKRARWRREAADAARKKREADKKKK